MLARKEFPIVLPAAIKHSVEFLLTLNEDLGNVLQHGAAVARAGLVVEVLILQFNALVAWSDEFDKSAQPVLGLYSCIPNPIEKPNHRWRHLKLDRRWHRAVPAGRADGVD